MIRGLNRCFSSFSQAKASLSYPLYNYARDIPESVDKTHWNLFQAVNSAIDLALESDPT